MGKKKRHIGDSEILLIADKGKRRNFTLFITMINQLITGKAITKKYLDIKDFEYRLQKMLQRLH